ncbi:MAG TPA: hypothetical protein VLS45_05120 [Methylomicrobium sp.]|nr:hypothetical protein [Methylomicrobium sp.]
MDTARNFLLFRLNLCTDRLDTGWTQAGHRLELKTISAAKTTGSGGSEAMPLLRSPTKHDMARVVHAAQCATIRAAAAAGRGQGRSTLKIDSEAFDRAKRILRSPIKSAAA